MDRTITSARANIEPEESDRDSGVSFKSIAVESEIEEPAKEVGPGDQPVSEEEAVGVIDLPSGSLKVVSHHSGWESRFPPCIVSIVT